MRSVSDLSQEQQFRELRRYKYAVGYVIEQEGSGVVERLVGDGTFSKFGVREDRHPTVDLEPLNRTDAEDLLREREWKFYGYPFLRSATVAAKIFDTQILFSPEEAIKAAQEVAGVGTNARLNRSTREALENASPPRFLDEYIELLLDDGQKQSVRRRIQRRPFRNVETTDL